MSGDGDEKLRGLERAFLADPSDRGVMIALAAERKRRGLELLPAKIPKPAGIRSVARREALYDTETFGQVTVLGGTSQGSGTGGNAQISGGSGTRLDFFSNFANFVSFQPPQAQPRAPRPPSV